MTKELWSRVLHDDDVQYMLRLTSRLDDGINIRFGTFTDHLQISVNDAGWHWGETKQASALELQIPCCWY